MNLWLRTMYSLPQIEIVTAGLLKNAIASTARTTTKLTDILFE